MILRSFFAHTIVLLLLFTSYCYSQDNDSTSWEKSYKQGLELNILNNFEQSKSFLQEAYSIANNSFSKTDKRLGDTAFQLGKTYTHLGKFSKAIPLIERAINITIEKHGTKSLEYIERVRFLGDVFYYNKNSEGALSTYNKALLLSYKMYGKNIDYAMLLKDKAFVYFDIGKYAKSSELLNINLRLYDSLSIKDLNYASTLSNLAGTYYRMGKNNESITLYKRANKIIIDKKQKNSGDYAVNLSGLAKSYIELGFYEKAIHTQKESLSLYDSLQKSSIEYAFGLNGMAQLSYEIGDYRSAEKLYEEILEIIKVNLSSDHPAYGQIRGSLGLVYERIGDYEKALTLSKEAQKNTLKSVGKEHPDYGKSLYNLAFIYGKLGEFDKSLKLYLEALEVYKNTYGIEHIEYGKLLNNIGKLYYQKSELKIALNYFNNAIKNLLLAHDKSHSNYSYYINDLANCQLDLGNYDQAISLMKENLKLSTTSENTNEESQLKKEYSLANAYNKTQRYDEAQKILKPASLKIEKLLGVEHSDYGKILSALAESYIGLGKLNEVIPLLKLSNENTIMQIDEIFKFRSEKEKRAFIQMLSKNFDLNQSIALVNSKKGELVALNLQNQIILKGLLLNNSKDLLNKLSGLKDSIVNNKILRYRSSKTKLTKYLNQNFPITIIDSLKAIINTEEIELVKLYSSNFDDNLEFQNWKTTHNILKKGEVAIEFSHFNYYEKGKVTDSIMYVAYVYKQEWNYPKLVQLFEEKELTRILLKKDPNQLYTPRGSKVVKSKNFKGLYELIWQPLENLIDKGDKIYFSPSGLLNQIPFAAITKKDGKNLNTKYNLVQLSSTAILASGITQPSIKKTLLIGGIDYNTDLKKEIDTKGWNYLPGTLTEITTIKNILESSKKEKRLLTDKNATEGNFKKINNNSPNVIHIATHGFFFENSRHEDNNYIGTSTEDLYRYAEDPLLRSGLIFAGANQSWNNSITYTDGDDGILNAMEIANLNLSTTDIVILSACETGLGDIEGNEGVYGLQRAFKMAGVNIVVMSLWQVPDKETAEFMELFYKFWIKSNDVRASFNKTQRKMQKKYKNEPLKWAAFVLFE